ncbi:MAG: acetate/propionate family kinase [Solirubrobacterales bacterium]|nr:acetate/propionate family kinase [Solirubrobacterales bacterium]
MRVLVVNAGSSSVKLSLLALGDETLAARELEAPRSEVDPGQLQAALSSGLGEADAVGHRIVHGGALFRAPVVIDAAVEAALRGLVDLAPLHQPKSLAALEAVSRALPGLPAVACFDTAFHAGMPDAAATYALPVAWTGRWGVRRYGFHGLSHAWVARRAPELLGLTTTDGTASDVRIVSCHLGAGASLCAISRARSVDTTMGFTPLEGLVMATRSGTVDPGLLLWLLDRGALSADELGHALEHESGLLGLAGTADMRLVVARAASGDQPARLALDVYLHRLRGGIAAMAAALGGLEVLVFTGGVGEHAAEVRAGAAEGLSFLGVTIDVGLNAGVTDDREISAAGAAVRTVVLHAREDVQIAHETRRVLGATPGV